jgi:hypothetical protein
MQALEKKDLRRLCVEPSAEIVLPWKVNGIRTQDFRVQAIQAQANPFEVRYNDKDEAKVQEHQLRFCYLVGLVEEMLG